MIRKALTFKAMASAASLTAALAMAACSTMSASYHSPVLPAVQANDSYYVKGHDAVEARATQRSPKVSFSMAKRSSVVSASAASSWGRGSPGVMNSAEAAITSGSSGRQRESATMKPPLPPAEQLYASRNACLRDSASVPVAARTSIPIAAQEQLVVELYSK